MIENNTDRPEIRCVAVFCGSRAGSKRVYADAAHDLGRCLAERRLELVYGGGCVGLMGILADSVLESGGTVTGVIPKALAEIEVAHVGLTHLHVVDTMHQRKALMAELADAFVALPGGYGTLEELCEILTWSQLGIHSKPIGLLNTAGYYDHLLKFLDCAVQEGFVSETNRSLLIDDSNHERLLDRLLKARPPSHPEELSIEQS